MSERVVIPEFLDCMSPDDPEAMRSRRDLRRVNRLMGNDQWICRTAAKFPEIAHRGIVEIGAGDGALCNRLQKLFPSAPVAAYDLAPAPPNLEPEISWHQGDIFEMPRPAKCGLMIANLFLHHFEGDALLALGQWMKSAELIIICEPARARLPHLLGGMMHPFINRITRHDMHVSIRAGFVAEEIIRLMGLAEPSRKFQETSTWRGARRIVG